MFSKTVLFAIFTAVFSQLNSVKALPDYSGCGEEYQCFGLSDGCLDTKSCGVLLKTQAQEGTGIVEFDLVWVRPSNASDSWVAAALSVDQKMGDDAASVFSIDQSQAKGVSYEDALTFVTHNNGSTQAGFNPATVKGVTVTKHTYSNGILHAKWTRTQKTTVAKLTFDMKAIKYYIFLAYGPKKDGHFGHHSDKGMSDKAINLEEDPTTSSPNATSPTPGTAKPTGTSGTKSGSSTPQSSSTKTSVSTPPPTVAPGSTTGGNSTATPGNSTGTEAPTRRPTTGVPTTTQKHGNNASTFTMSLFLTIFASILMFLN